MISPEKANEDGNVLQLAATAELGHIQSSRRRQYTPPEESISHALAAQRQYQRHNTSAVHLTIASKVGFEIVEGGHLGDLASVRRVSDVKKHLGPAGSGGNSTPMGEALETGLASVCSLTGATDTAECQRRY